MTRGTDQQESPFDQGLRKLMVLVGLILIVTSSGELFVQLWYQERPHIMLLAGLFLVGLLTLAQGVSRNPLTRRALSPPDLRLRSGGNPGEPVWSPDPRD
jgi:cell division protein FtsW (lipid II flippase)